MAGLHGPGQYGNVAKLIMQRYVYEPDTSSGKMGGAPQMSGAPQILHRRKELHNGKPAFDIDIYHSIAWVVDKSPAGGFWAHANLHAKKNGMFVYKDMQRQTQESRAVADSMPVGEWVRGDAETQSAFGDRTTFTLTSFPTL